MAAHKDVQTVGIPMDAAIHQGALAVPSGAKGLVLFAHGSGSGRLSPRNSYVAGVLRESSMATLLFDLLTEEEDRIYENRFDIDLLTWRLLVATAWVKQQAETQRLAIGYFGASTGAAAALKASAARGPEVSAVVSRGGRPDLALDDLPHVQAPTLLIVGGNDDQVIDLNRRAYRALGCEKELKIIPGATHLFEESGTLEQVAEAAAHWFGRYLSPKDTKP
ncbi:MAG: dienelactone hydrolase family protein [Gammaproteobacteria bacterium]|nr:dienelactone hydrolase family protein [Gammaproteobacteria bacterium]